MISGVIHRRYEIFNDLNTIKPVYSSHLRFLKKVFAIYRFGLFGQKKGKRNEDGGFFFSYDTSKQFE